MWWAQVGHILIEDYGNWPSVQSQQSWSKTCLSFLHVKCGKSFIMSMAYDTSLYKQHVQSCKSHTTKAGMHTLDNSLNFVLPLSGSSSVNSGWYLWQVSSSVALPWTFWRWPANWKLSSFNDCLICWWHQHQCSSWTDRCIRPHTRNSQMIRSSLFVWEEAYIHNWGGTLLPESLTQLWAASACKGLPP